MQLDQIFSAFDPTTRRAFETWMQQGGIALTNRGEQFNAAFADLYPFATNVQSVLAVLNRQSAATSTLLARRRRTCSRRCSRSPSKLQAFVRNNNALFAATAARDTEPGGHHPGVPGVPGRDPVHARTGWRRSRGPPSR